MQRTRPTLPSRRRLIAMMLGVFLIGIAVGFFRLAELGTDPFTAMNLGVSQFLGLDFATYQVGFNIMLLAVVFFTGRHYIGIGSLFNMVLVGYISTGVIAVIDALAQTTLFAHPESLPARISLLIAAVLLACLGVALYMTARLGVGPYDALARIVSTATGNRVSFRICRIATDTLAVVIGGVAYFAAGENVAAIVGVGTLIMALGTGPLVQLFIDRIAMPWLGADLAAADSLAAAPIPPSDEEHSTFRPLSDPPAAATVEE
ncbi:YczE/YyaS/YitT family protein [Jonesia quinghaiensis]|uniref:YczE/YyaS/YitT family protein n=1 Tax=Jonesia quinghaiensis TaxID=262806 RepID=UPI0003F5CF50|nr:membrane protein [Jonesia quinghaiensis]